MVEFNRYAAANQTAAPAMDEGLRKYMLGIYAYVAGALALNGALAYGLFASGLILRMGSYAPLIALLGAVGISLYAGVRLHKLSVSATQGLFWAYAALLSVVTSFYIGMYEPRSLIIAFFQTAAIFGGISLYGYTTKRDISGWGPLLMAGFIGVIAGSVVNLFLQSSGLGFAMSAIFTVLLIGSIAFETQRLRNLYYQMPDGEMKEKAAIHGALALFTDFLFLFFRMLQFFGDQR